MCTIAERLSCLPFDIMIINKPFTYSDYEVTSAMRREIENARSHFEGYADTPEAIKEMLNDLYDNN